MSYQTTNGAQLGRTGAPYPQITMGWFRCFLYAVNSALIFANSDNGNNWQFGTDQTTGTELTGLSQGSGGDSSPFLTGSNTAWIFICAIREQGVGSQFYWRLEGASSLSSTFQADTGLNDLSDEAVLIQGLSGTLLNQVSAFKEWTLSSSLTSTQILAESTQAAPIVTTALVDYMSCSVGSTVGLDTSGNNNNWTVTGVINIIADEPNMSIGPGSVAKIAWIV
jgi:hypothetical protein